jgi:hypothetical protein
VVAGPEECGCWARVFQGRLPGLFLAAMAGKIEGFPSNVIAVLNGKWLLGVSKTWHLPLAGNPGKFVGGRPVSENPTSQDL